MPSLLVITLIAISIVLPQANALRQVGYWGQSSSVGPSGTGPREQSLRHYCSTNNYDIIVVAFLYRFGSGRTTEINLSSHCYDSGSNPIASPGCQTEASDIPYCQSLGKIIILSMGGATTDQYGLSSDADGEAVAQEVWNKFLGGSASFRPFGAAIFDGIDLDIETNNPVGYGAFVNKLRSLFPSGPSARKYYISGAPQSPYPDASLGPAPGAALSTSHFDFIFVQFYNNNVRNIGGSYYEEALRQWATYGQSSNTLVFIGAPAADSPLYGVGYVSASTLIDAVRSAYNTYGATIGGTMLFDVSGEEINAGFAAQVRQGIASIGSTGASSQAQNPTSASASRASIASSASRTSAATSASSSSGSSPCGQPSYPPASGSCPTSGYMQCYGSSYQTCANNQWGPVQNCGAGTACSQSGNYIYCLSAPSSCPTTTANAPVTSNSPTSNSVPSSTAVTSCTGANDGYMRCAGQSTYQTCTNGQWSAYQSCQSGLRCSSSGNYVYCIQ